MKTQNIRPLGENVLIELLKPEEKTEAGLFLPQSESKERPQLGKVIAKGESEKILVKEGDTVIFRRYGGEEVKFNETDYLLASYKDILGVVEE
ncbi:MAG: co-chaperone GroES [Candidatus Moraniibacteriota bacterium]